jgi:hypothetical protein
MSKIKVTATPWTLLSFKCTRNNLYLPLTARVHTSGTPAQKHKLQSKYMTHIMAQHTAHKPHSLRMTGNNQTIVGKRTDRLHPLNVDTILLSPLPTAYFTDLHILYWRMYGNVLTFYNDRCIVIHKDWSLDLRMQKPCYPLIKRNNIQLRWWNMLTTSYYMYTRRDVLDENRLLPDSWCFIMTVLCTRGRINDIPFLSKTFPSLATRCMHTGAAIIPNNTTWWV